LDSDKKPVIGIVGGTGDLGTGIARRLTRAGYAVVIGSRTADNAHIACDALKQAAEAGGWGAIQVSSGDNHHAATAGDVVFVTVPFGAQRSTLDALVDHVSGKIVVDVTVPLVPPKVARVQLPAEGSAGQIAQDILGEGVRVVSALQNVAAAHLNSDAAIHCDVLVTGNEKSARQVVIDLLSAMGLTAYHAGLINNAAAAEALTSVLINLNKQFKTHAGIKITGLD